MNFNELVTDSPLIRYARGHFQECAILWDGYILPSPAEKNGGTNNFSSTVESYYGETITVPYPGYNGYHSLGPEITGRPDTFLWCGVLLAMLREISRYQILVSGTQQINVTVKIHAMPTQVEQALAIAFSESFFALCFPSQQIFLDPKTFGITNFEVDTGIFSHLIFAHDYEQLHWIGVKKFTRLHFIFLDSLSPAAWAGVLLTLQASAVSIAAVVVFHRRRRRKLRPCQILGPYLQSLVLWTLRLFGYLLGQYESENDQRRKISRTTLYRFSLGCWLVGCVTLTTCLGGSMRDLMSSAPQLHAPSSVEDLLHSPLFADYVFLNVWPGPTELSLDSDPALDNPPTRLYRQGRYIHIDGLACYNDGLACIAKLFMQIFLLGGKIALRNCERELLLARWALDLYRGVVINALDAQILSHGPNYEMNGKNLLSHLERNVFNQLHVPIDKDSRYHIYIPLAANVPRRVVEQVSDTADRFRGAGLIEYAFERGDAKLGSRYLAADSESDSGRGYAQLLAQDLTGVFILWAAMIVFATAIFAAEYFIAIRMAK